MTSNSPPRRFSSRRALRHRQPVVQDRRRGGELGARFEQRHRHHVWRGLRHGRARQRQHAREVGGRTREAHDHALACAPHRGATGCRRSRGTWRAPHASAPTVSPSGATASSVAGGGQDARVLPHLHRGQVEAERLDLPAEVLQLAPRQPRRTAGVERPLQHVEVAQERTPGRRSHLWRRCGSRPVGARPVPSLRRCGASDSVRASSWRWWASAFASRSSAARSARLGRTSRSETDSVRAMRREAASRPRSTWSVWIAIAALVTSRGHARVAVAIASDPGAPSKERRERRRPHAAPVRIERAIHLAVDGRQVT